MSEVLKILGQQAPAQAAQLVDLYVVPDGRDALVRSLFVTNRSGNDQTFEAFVVKAGQQAGNANVLVPGITVQGNDVLDVLNETAGISLGAGDKIQVRVAAATLTFHAFGLERN